MRRALPFIIFLLTSNLIQAQPGLEAYDRGDLDAVRAYLAAGKGRGAEADFLRAAMTADGDSAAEMYRQVAVKYPDGPIGNRALKRLHNYYYAKGLYTRADEVVKNPSSLKAPLRQTDSPDSSAPKSPTPKTVTPPVETTKTAPEIAKPEPDTEPPAASDHSGYTLQLGSFANPENVAKLKKALEKSGYTIEVSSANIGGEHLQRIHAVGFKDKDAALAAAGELKKKFGLNPILDPTCIPNSQKPRAKSQ
jgi:cell division septation protein DedD